MWDSETERIGKRKCTPVGYAMHGIADLLGFIGLLLLCCFLVYIGYKWIAGGFHAYMWWLLGIPFGIDVIGDVLYYVSWTIAYKRGYEYDPEKRIASWEENGIRITYRAYPKTENK